MLSSSAGTDRTSPEGAYDEDLPALAALQFRLAQELCGDCRNYHALFGYGRIAGANGGMAADRNIVAALLSQRARSAPRVLIAGAADAGLLALTARALHPLRPRITVADRCPTPLSLCERFAALHGLHIGTVRTELTEMRGEERYDIVLAHYVLSYIPAGHRPAFFAVMRAALAAEGRFLLVCRGRRASASDPGRKFSGMAAALAAKGVALPEPEADFARRTEALDDFRSARDSGKATPEEIEALFAAARLRVSERFDYQRHDERAGASTPIRSHFFVAVPM